MHRKIKWSQVRERKGVLPAETTGRLESLCAHSSRSSHPSALTLLVEKDTGFGEHGACRGGNTVLLSSCRKKTHFVMPSLDQQGNILRLLSVLEAAPPKC